MCIRDRFKYYDNILNPFFQESKRRARAEALNEIESLAIENSRVVSTLANYFLGKIYFCLLYTSRCV